MLSVTNLECIRNEQVLFSNLSFTLKPGEILHVTGANGSGKSSLLQILSGLLSPHQGELYWQGAIVANADSNYFAQLIYIGHKTGVKSGLTVMENLKMISQLSHSFSVIDWDFILSYLALTSFKQVLCHRLSAGQRQRVALARLLILDAPLWILDEPFTAIDKEGLGLIQTLLMNHTRKGGVAVLSSHQSFALQETVIKQIELNYEA